MTTELPAGDKHRPHSLLLDQYYCMELLTGTWMDGRPQLISDHLLHIPFQEGGVREGEGPIGGRADNQHHPHHLLLPVSRSCDYHMMVT